MWAATFMRRRGLSRRGGARLLVGKRAAVILSPSDAHIPVFGSEAAVKDAFPRARTALWLTAAAALCLGSCEDAERSRFSRTAVVKRGRFEINIVEEGQLRALESTTITAKEGGKIEWLAPEGEMVKKGDVLVRMEKEDLEDQLERFRSDLKDAQSKLDELRQSFDKEKDDLEDEVTGLKLALDLAQLRLDMLLKQPDPADKEKAFADLKRREVLLKNARDERDRLERLWEAKAVSHNEVLQAEMQAKVAEAYYERQKLFYDELSRGASPLDLEKAKLDLEAARLNYELAQEQARNRIARLEQDIKRAELAVQRCEGYCRRTEMHIQNRTLYAPHQGLVIYYQQSGWRTGNKRRKVDVGSTVWTGAAIIELPNLERMKVRTQVSESNIRFVSLGAKALVQVDIESLADITYHGKIVWISKTGRDRNSTLDYAERRREGLAGVNVFDIEIALDESDSRLKLGSKAKVKIPIKTFENVVYAPKEAIRFSGGKPVVWIVKGEEKEVREVKLGEENDTDVIIKKGLRGAERVALR